MSGGGMPWYAPAFPTLAGQAVFSRAGNALQPGMLMAPMHHYAEPGPATNQ